MDNYLCSTFKGLQWKWWFVAIFRTERLFFKASALRVRLLWEIYFLVLHYIGSRRYFLELGCVVGV